MLGPLGKEKEQIEAGENHRKYRPHNREQDNHVCTPTDKKEQNQQQKRG